MTSLQCHYNQSHSDGSTFIYGKGNAPIHIRYVYCKGTEPSLAECGYSTVTPSRAYVCRYSRGIVGVQCISSKN